MAGVAENLTTLLREAEASFRSSRYGQAEAGFRRVLELDPSSHPAHNGIGTSLIAQGQFAQAERLFRTLLSRNPEDPIAVHNLGNALAGLRRLGEAEAAFREALRLRPNLPDTHAALGMVLLTLGRFEGFTEYEWRWRTRRMVSQARKWPVPQWRGEPLEGRTLLLHAEQGFGDTLQFCRYIRLIEGGKVILEAPGPLTHLLGRLEGLAQVIARGETLPPIDFHCPLMSVPLAMRSTVKVVPARVPYLTVDAAPIARSRATLRTLAGLKVGLVWAGQPSDRTSTTDVRRSMTLATLAPLSEVPGVSFISLQTDGAAAQVDSQSGALGPWVQSLEPPLRDFTDTAAVIENLDLVIGVDTAAVHLTGALGKKVWLLNDFDACWRWLDGRDDSPWYPTLRQFRQSAAHDWKSVIERVRKALLTLAASQGLDNHALLSKAQAHVEAREDVEAETVCEQLLWQDWKHAEAWHLRSVIAHRGKRLEEALRYSIIAIESNDAEPRYQHHNGKLLWELRRYPEAEARFRTVINSGHAKPRVLNDLGQMANMQGRFGAAEECFREAVRLEPNNAIALSNLGNVMRSRNRFVEAEALYREAARRDPTVHDPYGNLGVLLAELGRFDEALSWYAEAIRRQPEHPEIHANRAMTNLMAGRFEAAWPEYEWRWRTAHFASVFRTLPAPQWQGEPLAGRELLVHAEQGFGDSLQFCRYIPMVKDAKIILEVHQPLVRLLSRLPGVTRIVPVGRPLPSFDVHCPMLSLPGVFGTVLQNIPAPIPYLSPDPDEVNTWRERLKDLPGVKVGLVWAGEWRPHLAAVDKRRSITLELLAPLADLPGVSFISLQKGKAAKQAKSPPPGLELHDFTAELHDFAATAALMECLDLIISVDTAPVHLAGALGKPIWLLNRFEACWRWMRHRDDSPWYPSLRQFRQPRPGEWKPVIGNVREALRALAR